MRGAAEGCRLFWVLNRGEAVKVGFEDVALQEQMGELPFPHDLDKSRCFQLFKVMRERGGGHRLALAHVHAGDSPGFGAHHL